MTELMCWKRVGALGVGVLVAQFACSNATEPPVPETFINVDGTFIAESFDGQPGPVRLLTITCPFPDTTAVAFVEEMKIEFHDENSAPKLWDNARLSIAAPWSCPLSGIIDSMLIATDSRYRATTDTLFLRDDRGLTWARVPWVVQGQAFDLEQRLGRTDVVVRFVRQPGG